MASSSSRGGSKRTKITQNFPVSHFWNQDNQTSFLQEQQTKRLSHGDYLHTPAGNERSIEHGMIINRTFLRHEHFGNLVDLLEFQNWGDFVTCSADYQPTLVRLFYHNILPIGNAESTDKYKSKVYGKVVNVSPRSLGNYMFGNNNVDGVVVTGTNFGSCFPGYTLAMGTESLLEPNCANRLSRKSVDMTTENRLLFHILTHVITPRSGSYSEATIFDVGLMFLIKNRIKINLASLVFYHMRKVFKTPSMSLVYPVFLTNYLIDACGTPSVESEGISMTKYVYDRNALSLLFKYNSETMRWVKKYGRAYQVQEEEIPQREEAPQEEEHTHDSPGNPNRHILDSLDRLESNQFGLRQEVDRVHYRMDNMERSLEDIQEMLRNMGGGGSSGPSYHYFHQ